MIWALASVLLIQNVDFVPEKLTIRRNEILSDLQKELVKKFNRHGRAVRRGQSDSLARMTNTSIQTATRRLRASRSGIELQKENFQEKGKVVFEPQPFELAKILRAMNPYQADLASNILQQKKWAGRVLSGRTFQISGFKENDFSAMAPFCVAPTSDIPPLGDEKPFRKFRSELEALKKGPARGSYLVVVPGVILPDASYALLADLVVEQLSAQQIRVSLIRERRNTMAAQVVGHSEPLVFAFHPSDLNRPSEFTCQVEAWMYTRWVSEKI